MKRPADVVGEVNRRLARTWAEAVAGEGDAPAWPHRFSLAQAAGQALEESFSDFAATAREWRDWVGGFDVELIDRGRRVGGVTHSIPAQVIVPSVYVAARIAGGEWSQRLQRGRGRLALLQTRFPDMTEHARMLRETDRFSDVDFELLLRAGAWFATHRADGLTSRQVPLEGFHAKWLNTRQHLVAKLASVPDLGLARNHPARIHFTYLDPEHRANGGRVHDSATVGDRFTPAYRPEIVVISENKDTAINFPELSGAISVEGVGKGGGTFTAFDWLVQAPTVIYWGDMDADGLEILNEFLAVGVPAQPIFMDLQTFDEWERYGTDVDQRGNLIGPREAREVNWLTGGEKELYLALVSPDWTRVRRIEQERIPLERARAAVLAAAALSQA